MTESRLFYSHLNIKTVRKQHLHNLTKKNKPLLWLLLKGSQQKMAGKMKLFRFFFFLKSWFVWRKRKQHFVQFLLSQRWNVEVLSFTTCLYPKQKATEVFSPSATQPDRVCDRSSGDEGVEIWRKQEKQLLLWWFSSSNQVKALPRLSIRLWYVRTVCDNSNMSY